MATAMEIELRERITRLEAKLETLTEKIQVSSEKLEEIHIAFNQAKGARWVIVGAAGIAGFLASKAGMVFSWFGSMPR